MHGPRFGSYARCEYERLGSTGISFTKYLFENGARTAEIAFSSKLAFINYAVEVISYGGADVIRRRRFTRNMLRPFSIRRTTVGSTSRRAQSIFEKGRLIA